MCFLLFEIDCNLLQIIVGAAVTDHEFVLAWDHAHGVCLSVPTLETAAGQVDGDSLVFPWSQLYLLIGAKGLQRAFHICYVADIHLNGLQACHCTCVLDTYLYLVVLIFWLANLEVCVTETIAEGEQGLPCEVTVGAVRHLIVKEVGQVVSALVEGYGQFSTGVVVAEENLCQCLTT